MCLNISASPIIYTPECVIVPPELKSFKMRAELGKAVGKDLNDHSFMSIPDMNLQYKHDVFSVFAWNLRSEMQKA